jgi:hypothetical protein
MFETCDKSYVDAIAKYENMPGRTSMTIEGLKVGYRNYLVNSAYSFYQTGHTKYAQRIYAKLGSLFPEAKYQVPFMQFVHERMKDEMDLGGLDATNAIEAVVNVMREAYFQYALREDDAAASLERVSREAYDIYIEKYGDEKLEVPGVQGGRLDIPDFKTLRYLALTQFLQDDGWPAELRQALLSRIQVERPELMKELDAIYQQLQQRQQEAQKKDQK